MVADPDDSAPAFDPTSVPIRPAATVMLLADRPGLEVLLLKRNAKIVFAGDMWVYPGGRVDASDAEAFEPHCSGFTDADASALLGMASGGLAFWVAAIRECFEEAGLLLGTAQADGAADRLARHRELLNEGSSTFLEIVLAESIALDPGRIHPVAHWVTPLGSPRRYDTRFFVTAMPQDQTAAHDAHEAVNHGWFTAEGALARERAGELIMMTPTIRMLQCLAAFGSADEALEGAYATHEAEQVRVRTEESDRALVLPGDPGYESADPEIETGFVSWRPGSQH